MGYDGLTGEGGPYATSCTQRAWKRVNEAHTLDDLEDKRTLKAYAANQDKTVAKVIREWIDEKCKGAN